MKTELHCAWNRLLRIRDSRRCSMVGIGLGVILALLGSAQGASSQDRIERRFTDLNLLIPDNNPSGVALVQTLSGNPAGSLIVDVNVRLKLRGDGARNGDLFATLEHQSGYTVLLNRVGRSEQRPFGYQDPGLNILLDDEAEHGDVHRYRARLFGNDETPVGQALDSFWAGGWAADGRNIDPADSYDIVPRRATLSSMKGLSVDGRWRLYIADVAPGGISELVEWSLDIEYTTDQATLDLLFENATIRADAESREITVPVSIKGTLAVSGRSGTALSGPISGVGEVVKDGAGVLTLSGVNTFSGGIALEQGALVLNNERATGLGPISMKGGTIRASGGAKRVDNALRLAGDVVFGGDPLEFAGLVTVDGISPMTIEGETIVSGDIQEDEPGSGFVKSGNGKLTLTGANTFSGGIALEQGTLAIGNNRALGTGPVTLKGGSVEATGGARSIANPVELSGKLKFAGADLLTFTGPIKLGAGSTFIVEGETRLSGVLEEDQPGNGFVKQGNGTLLLAGANTISGGVAIEEGRLLVSNLTGSATGSGPVSIGSRAILGGNGTIAGPVLLAGGATLAPGASPGRLTTGSQTWEGGAVLVVEINNTDGGEGTDPGWDTLSIHGNLEMNGDSVNPVIVKLVSLGLNNEPGSIDGFDPSRDYAWRIAQTTGGLGTATADRMLLDASGFRNPINGGSFGLEVRGNDLFLVFAGVRPVRVSDVQLIPGGLRLTVQGSAGVDLFLEATDSLSSGNWTRIATMPGALSGEVVFELASIPEELTRFYRVVVGN